MVNPDASQEVQSQEIWQLYTVYETTKRQAMREFDEDRSVPIKVRPHERARLKHLLQEIYDEICKNMMDFTDGAYICLDQLARKTFLTSRYRLRTSERATWEQEKEKIVQSLQEQFACDHQIKKG